MVLHGLAGQIPEPVRDLGLQVTMGQTSCLLATQPLQRLREQPTQGTKRVLVGFQRVRLHPGLLLSRFGLRHQDRREGAPSYRSTRPWPPETQRQPPSRVGATPFGFTSLMLMKSFACGRLVECWISPCALTSFVAADAARRPAANATTTPSTANAATSRVSRIPFR